MTHLDPMQANPRYPQNPIEILKQCLDREDWKGVLNLWQPLMKQAPPNVRPNIMQAAFVAYYNLGDQASREKRYEESLKCFMEAQKISPFNAQLANQIGNVFSNINEFEEARSYFSRAVGFDPDLIMAYVNLAYVSHRLGDHKREEQLTEYILKIDPDNVLANWHHGLWSLLRGDYETGWKQYEWRYRHPIFISQNKSGFDLDEAFFKKYWRGEKLTDKALLIFSEQGFGDFIQFCRYIPLLKRRKIKTHVACLPELIPLIKDWSCIESVVPIGDVANYPKYSKHVYLLSLPGIFKTTLNNIPHKVPYIHPPKPLLEEWRDKMPDSNNLKVGICCTGNQNTVVSKIRSCTLKDFEPIFALKGIDFYDLHVKDKAPNSKDYPMIDLTNDIKSFMDSAALISNLDLVITIETAVAHLAGALNVPTYVVLAKTPAWRWLLDREDSPWYPSAKLFRQSQDKDWTFPIQAVIKALAEDFRSGKIRQKD